MLSSMLSDVITCESKIQKFITALRIPCRISFLKYKVCVLRKKNYAADKVQINALKHWFVLR
jgi:hypothetical protein